MQEELLLRKRHDGKWHRYHLESKSMVPLTLNIGSLYRVPNPIISLGSEQYLFRIHNEGWYRMNLIEGTVEPESDSGLHENTMWVGNASAGHEYVYILSSE